MMFLRIYVLQPLRNAQIIYWFTEKIMRSNLPIKIKMSHFINQYINDSFLVYWTVYAQIIN